MDPSFLCPRPPPCCPHCSLSLALRLHLEASYSPTASISILLQPPMAPGLLGPPGLSLSQLIAPDYNGGWIHLLSRLGTQPCYPCPTCSLYHGRFPVGILWHFKETRPFLHLLLLKISPSSDSWAYFLLTFKILNYEAKHTGQHSKALS